MHRRSVIDGEVRVHELAISEAIVTEVSERMAGSVVLRVVLEIGRLSAVEPEAVRFCFALAAKGTIVEGATLDIVEIPAVARCRSCRSLIDVEDFLVATCPRCGGATSDLVTGQELRIRSVEVL